MSLAIERKNGMFYPVLVCDMCGQVIRDWHRAAAVFKPDRAGGISDVQVYHKVRCDPGGSYWYVLELYIGWLLKDRSRRPRYQHLWLKRK